MLAARTGPQTGPSRSASVVGERRRIGVRRRSAPTRGVPEPPGVPADRTSPEVQRGAERRSPKWSRSPGASRAAEAPEARSDGPTHPYADASRSAGREWNRALSRTVPTGSCGPRPEWAKPLPFSCARDPGVLAQAIASRDPRSLVTSASCPLDPPTNHFPMSAYKPECRHSTRHRRPPRPSTGTRPPPPRLGHLKRTRRHPGGATLHALGFRPRPMCQFPGSRSVWMRGDAASRRAAAQRRRRRCSIQ